ncbi:hypothetical protein DAEQUDRAFT_728773 [Daedalea quercina L-15889]|uniref:F-box domain-containing protein n=1 Tax=Daedalea quercina L-15889 TaxID=1314783 RepID=A0A165P548_9APHY|nr:hypothetical protein DAEQUDRAFT_728773 [Daedalea quercina L-15889]
MADYNSLLRSDLHEAVVDSIESNTAVGQQPSCVSGLLAGLSGLPSDVVHPVIDHSLQALQVCLDRINELKRNLRISRNSSARVNRLPDELFAEIFWYIAQADPCHRRRLSEITGLPTLIPVTHVCKHWRSMALENARLWATLLVEGFSTPGYISLGAIRSTALMAEYLRRSKSHPLSITTMPLSEDCVVDFADILQPHIHRIKRLHIRTGTEFAMLFVLLQLQMAAPHLEELSLEVSHSTEIQHSYLEYWDTILFCGQTPSLRSLSLSQVSIPLGVLWLRGLRHLTLNAHNMHMNAFLDALEKCPSLEALIILDDRPSAPLPGTSTIRGRVVSLPTLRSLTITLQSPFTIGHFLAHIRLPGMTRITINTRIHHLSISGSVRWALLPPVGRDFIHTISSLRTLQVLMHSNNHMSLRGYTRVFDLTGAPNIFTFAAQPELTMDLHCSSPACLLAWLVAEHTGGLPIGAIDTLLMGYSELVISREEWAGFLRSMHGLRSLYLAGTAEASLRSCLHALGARETDEHSGPVLGSSVPLLVQLQRLIIVEDGFDSNPSLRAALETAVQCLCADGALQRLDLVEVMGSGRRRPDATIERLGQFCTVEFSEDKL